jgi:lysophospholipase L1-like esterase
LVDRENAGILLGGCRAIAKEDILTREHNATSGKSLPAVTSHTDPITIINALIWLFVFGFSLATLLILWRWGQGYNVPSYLFILAPSLTLVALFTQKLSREAKYNLTLLLISLGLSAYAAEGFLTGYGNPKDFDNRRFVGALSKGILYDQRPIIQVAKDMREQGIEAVPFVSPGNFDSVSKIKLINGQPIYPLAHIANTTTIFCNELGNYIIYESDEHGFHNPPNLWHNQPIDIAVVGDSFAQGACVDSTANAPATIRQTFPQTLNLGLSGTGPLITLAILREYVAPLKPPAVVWFYFEENDFLDLQDEQLNPILREYLASADFSQNLYNRQADIDQVRREFVWATELELDNYEAAQNYPSFAEKTWTFLRLYELRRLLNITFEAPPETLPTTNEAIFDATAKAHYEETLNHLPENLKLFKQILGEAKRIVSAWDGELVVVYIPAYIRQANPDTAESNFHRPEVLRVLGEENVTVLDFYGVLQTHPDPLSLYPYRLNGHFNEAGYAYLGKTVVDYIEANNLLPQ